MEYTDIETELTRDREARKARRQECDIIYSYGAKPATCPSSLIDANKAAKQLEKMTKTEEATFTRYTSMPEIEFSTPLPLRVKIPSHAAQKKAKLRNFKQKLDSSGAVEVSDCGLPRVYFKEIGT